MQALIADIRARLAESAYVNEAAVSQGIVIPVLNALGWNSADPNQLVPEYSVIGRGRVDYALLGRGRKPAVFIEVKGVGLAIDGDKQLFEYAFHEGVPLCVLTDGREWSFFLPAGIGKYDERRVYRLQLDDRDPAECERVLIKYLAQERVCDGRAAGAARQNHENAHGHRQAISTLPRAWRELLEDDEGLVLETVADKAEALCGYKPELQAVRAYLQCCIAGLQLRSRRGRPSLGRSHPRLPLQIVKPWPIRVPRWPKPPRASASACSASLARLPMQASRWLIFSAHYCRPRSNETGDACRKGQIIKEEQHCADAHRDLPGASRSRPCRRHWLRLAGRTEHRQPPQDGNPPSSV